MLVALKATLDRCGIAPEATSTATLYRDVIETIGRTLDPAFTLDRFDFVAYC